MAGLEQAKELFRKQFGTEPTHAASAPGRVNIIGEHVDYCDGFVLPMALEYRTYIVGKPNGTNKYRVITGNMDPAYAEWTTSDEDLAPTGGKKEPKWTNYIRGVIAQFDKKEGLDMAVISNVPIGGGLSSSAALEVAVYTLLEQVLNDKRDKVTKAKDCQKAENHWAGMPCGIMDQAIIALGEVGHLLLLDCRSMDTRLVRMADPNVVVLITNSNVKHELTGSEYPARRQATVDVKDAIHKKFPEVTSLRDATMAQLDAVKGDLDEERYKRGRHVLGEIARTTKFAEELEAGHLREAGKLMLQSHYSLSGDFEVSTPEIDQLVEICKDFPGVYGTRITGGGFGGCTVTLVEKGQADALIDHIHKNYTLGTATCFVSAPGDGAHAESL